MLSITLERSFHIKCTTRYYRSVMVVDDKGESISYFDNFISINYCHRISKTISIEKPKLKSMWSNSNWKVKICINFKPCCAGKIWHLGYAPAFHIHANPIFTTFIYLYHAEKINKKIQMRQSFIGLMGQHDYRH